MKENLPEVGVEVIARIRSKSVRFGTEHLSVDICYVDESGQWRCRTAGELYSSKTLIGVEEWEYLPESITAAFKEGNNI